MIQESILEDLVRKIDHARNAARESGRESGIREVVAWIESHRSYYGCSQSRIVFETSPEEWEEQKRSWGILNP